MFSKKAEQIKDSERKKFLFFCVSQHSPRPSVHFFSLFLSVLHFVFVGLEADLQDPIAEGVPVQGLDRDQALVVVCHGDEAESLALVRLQIADDLDVLNGAEGAKELPEDVLLGIGSEVVHEDAPAAAVHGGCGRRGGSGLQEGISRQQISSQGGISENKKRCKLQKNVLKLVQHTLSKSLKLKG